MRGRQLNLADAAARAAPEPANVVGDFEQTDRDRFELATGFDYRIFSALRFEMIFCLIKSNAGPLLQMTNDFGGKIDMSI